MLLNKFKGDFIDQKILAGLLSVFVLTSCATLRDSLILGAGSGAAVGGIIGSQSQSDSGENALRGAVIGGIVGGIASYIIHGSLESRDTRVRRDTLLNLEKFDVLGRDRSSENVRSDKCHTTRDVDGRLVSIPCRYLDDPGQEQ